MNNNDILIRLRYALDLKDAEMLKIFELGGKEVTREELRVLLTKQNKEEELPKDAVCDNQTLEIFLNGFITYKRGKPPVKNGAAAKPTFLITNLSNVNNVLLKKVKIALALTSDEMLDVLRLAGVYASDSELSAILRKEGHRNYQKCGDRYARNFLKGLAIKYREQ
ncbi:DUF1456 family protein [Erwinia sp. CPCC 100877]|nr:DUF1456 family protein [Erwinia sp. CPCC 100877]